MSESETASGPSIALRTRIYLEDTDAGGVVYHTSYLRFMERARTELLRSLGLQQSATFKAEISFVVHSMNLRFHAPALLDSEVITNCEIQSLSGASLSFKQTVRAAEGSGLYVSADVIVACINLVTKRPRRIPTELSALLRGSALGKS